MFKVHQYNSKSSYSIQMVNTNDNILYNKGIYGLTSVSWQVLCRTFKSLTYNRKPTNTGGRERKPLYLMISMTVESRQIVSVAEVKVFPEPTLIKSSDIKTIHNVPTQTEHNVGHDIEDRYHSLG